MDFQKLGSADFADEAAFCAAFSDYMLDTILSNSEVMAALDAQIVNAFKSEYEQGRVSSLRTLFANIRDICGMADKPMVLMIDEVDSASNNQVFVDFLAQLRVYYLSRERIPAIHSVILAGVYDIKNLRLKLRPDEEHQYNSPWNVATDFDIRMEFTAGQIESMLDEYAADKAISVNTAQIAQIIYEYTAGYPYLVSALCKIIDEELLCDFWTRQDVEKAVNIFLSKKSTLFDSMVKQIDVYDDLRQLLEDIIYRGKQIPYDFYYRAVNLGVMFGF